MKIIKNIFDDKNIIPDVCYEQNHSPCVTWNQNGSCTRVISTFGDNVNVGGVLYYY